MANTEYSRYKKLSLGSILPEGWLKTQLELQAQGLTGNVDKLWSDLSDKSAWLGGKGEAWERGPYYLDGLIPLAYLLNDPVLIDKVNRWVKCILESQGADGNFGPKRTADWWPRAVALKALIGYYEYTEYKPIIVFFRKYFKYMYNNIDDYPPKYWASARAMEFLIPLTFLYNITGDEFLIEIAQKLKQYSYDWDTYFSEIPYRKSANKYLNKTLINLGRKLGARADDKKKKGVKPLKKESSAKILAFNKKNLVKKLMLSHGVNVAMAIKYPALYGYLFSDAEAPAVSKRGLYGILKYHGTATGAFTSDEQLDGACPSKGIELCEVVEQMYSVETLLQLSGDPSYGDMLELLAFNTLPATFTADMCAHQYVQQPNQIACTEEKRDFFDVDKDGNLYGLKPNYGCCLANMHQGFPKFVQNLCYQKDNELIFFVYGPCTVDTKIGDMDLRIREQTDYPFKNKIKFMVECATGTSETKLAFRVPAYTTMTVSVCGKEVATENRGIVRLRRTLRTGDVIELSFDAPLTPVINADKSLSIRKGSILLAAALKGKKTPLRGTAPFCDFAVTTQSQWRVSPIVNKKSLEIISETENNISERPFDPEKPPYSAVIKARYVGNWKIKRNSAAAPPKKPTLSDSVINLTLTPYGATDIRISQFATGKRK